MSSASFDLANNITLLKNSCFLIESIPLFFEEPETSGHHLTVIKDMLVSGDLLQSLVNP